MSYNCANAAFFDKTMQQRTDSSKQYYVTYCVLDGRSGANPFGHSCLIFSHANDENIQVEKAYGYYSQPSSTTNPLLKWVKNILGIKYDLQNTHAILREEKMRDLIGDGLKGISFAINAAEYQHFLQEFAQGQEQQRLVLDELDRQLQQQGMLPNGVARYALQKKQGETVPARVLKPFHLRLGRGASTCKQLALNALEEHQVIDSAQRTTLEHHGMKYPFPIFSGQALAPLRFHAQGPLQAETSSSGKKFYNPNFASNQLFWSLPIYTGGKNFSSIIALDRQFKSIAREYNHIRAKLYAINFGKSHDILTKMIAELEQQANQLQAQDGAALAQLTSLVNIAKGVLNENYYKTSVWQRLLHHQPLILQLSGLFLTLGLMSLISSVSLVLPIICGIAGLSLYSAATFLRREQCWHQSKQEYQAFLAGFSSDVQQSLPCLMQGLRN